MSDYSQPDFYHFSEDSLWLVDFVKSEQKEIDQLLDVCAGCGIIGIEIMRDQISTKNKNITFFELQRDFEKHITKNVETFVPAINTELLIGEFSHKGTDKLFDCIVCNPPYFERGCGREKNDKRAQLCRTFEKGSLQELLELMLKKRAPGGRAYFLGRNDLSMNDIKRQISFEERARKKNISIYELS